MTNASSDENSILTNRESGNFNDSLFIQDNHSAFVKSGANVIDNLQNAISFIRKSSTLKEDNDGLKMQIDELLQERNILRGEKEKDKLRIQHLTDQNAMLKKLYRDEWDKNKVVLGKHYELKTELSSNGKV